MHIENKTNRSVTDMEPVLFDIDNDKDLQRIVNSIETGDDKSPEIGYVFVDDDDTTKNKDLDAGTPHVPSDRAPASYDYTIM